MEDDSQRAPDPAAETEARRRAEQLVELRRRRRKRRWIVGLAAVAATATVGAGSVVAWGAQAQADALASGIVEWHEQHDRAACELAVRIVSAVGLERRTADVLRAAQHVPSAEALLGARERASFAAQRDALLATIDGGGFVDDDDRAVAREWQARAAAADEPESFDVLAACVADADAVRAPVADVTPEQVGELARTLRALGDPRRFDDSRIDRLEASIAQLQPTAIALARSRQELGALEASMSLAPEQALDSVRDADAHIRGLLDRLDGDHSLGDALDLVEALALHVAAGWMAEAWQLEAAGELEAAAARAAAAQSARDAIAEAAPRPITDRGPVRPRPPAPPLSQPPSPVPSSPAPGTGEPPVDPIPVDPAPVDPVPSQPAPTDPAPSEPAPVEPTDPAPSPSLEPDPGIVPTEPAPGALPGRVALLA